MVWLARLARPARTLVTPRPGKLTGKEKNVMVDAKALSALVGSIYDCVLDSSRWEQTLDAVKAALCCETVSLGLLDLRRDRILINRTVGIPAAGLEEQAKHMPEINARLARDLVSWPSFDEPHLMSRHIPPAELESSRYVQDCLKPNGIIDIMLYFLLHTPARLGVIGMGRHEHQGIFTE